jgi:hypothetical protein
MAPLLFSSLCYFAAFFILGTSSGNAGPSEAVEITKLVLWYLPIIVEIISHFAALSLPGFVRYSTDSVYKRSGTVFLIMCVYFPSAPFAMLMSHLALELAWTRSPVVSRPSSGIQG